MHRYLKLAVSTVLPIALLAGCNDWLTGNGLTTNPNRPVKAGTSQLFIGVTVTQTVLQTGDFARLFQAVRIAVNDELGRLAEALPALRDRLAPGGRIAVIAYHSGEDRLVKHAFREWSTGCICPPRQPLCTCGHVPLGETVTRRAIEASDAERAHNPRARSAKLRVWQRAEAA